MFKERKLHRSENKWMLLFRHWQQISYDFCNDDPIPSQQPGTISSFEVYVPGLCVYKKPDGEFGFVNEHVPAVI